MGIFKLLFGTKFCICVNFEDERFQHLIYEGDMILQGM
jgi:hypothetical protein